MGAPEGGDLNVGTLILEPHNLGDDAALFCAFTAIRERAHVITVLRSVKQDAYGIAAETRERESEAAMRLLGCTWEQWAFPDTDPDWGRIADLLPDVVSGFDAVYAPAFLDGGHEQHNALAAAVMDATGGDFGGYLTYRRHGGKATDGTPVEFDPAWIRVKLQALACYRSQIETAAANCWMWFLGDQREYVA